MPIKSNQNLRIFVQVRPSEMLNGAMLFVASSCDFLLCAEVHVYCWLWSYGLLMCTALVSPICFFLMLSVEVFSSEQFFKLIWCFWLIQKKATDPDSKLAQWTKFHINNDLHLRIGNLKDYFN